jgi:hypothetical protein
MYPGASKPQTGVLLTKLIINIVIWNVECDGGISVWAVCMVSAHTNENLLFIIFYCFNNMHYFVKFRYSMYI